MSKNHNLTRLEFLEPGQTFETNLETLRNGVFLFSTVTASLCIIDEFKNGTWYNNSREYLGNSVMVQVTGSVELVKGQNGLLEIAGRTEADRKTLKESRKVAEIDSEKLAKKTNKAAEREERKKNLLELKAKKHETAARNRIEREKKNSLKKVAKAAAPGGQTGKSNRGRKKKVLPPIIFPKGEFTLISLAEANGVKNYDIKNEIDRLKSLGEKIEIVRYQANKRGRPTPFYIVK